MSVTVSLYFYPTPFIFVFPLVERKICFRLSCIQCFGMKDEIKVLPTLKSVQVDSLIQSFGLLYLTTYLQHQYWHKFPDGS